MAALFLYVCLPVCQLRGVSCFESAAKSIVIVGSRRLGLPDDASFEEVIDAKTFLAEVTPPAVICQLAPRVTHITEAHVLLSNSCES